MYFATPVEAVSMISALLACGYALWRGGGPERLAAALLLADWIITPIIDINSDPMKVHLGVFVLDSLVATVMVAQALSTSRYWPLWLAAFQLLELLMHLAMGLDHKVHARAYFIGIEISSYLILAALSAGTWLEAPRGRFSPRAVRGGS